MKKTFLPSLLSFICLVLVFEAMSRLSLIPSYILPAPHEVFISFIDDAFELFSASLQTIFSAFVGLVLSFCVGVTLAVFLSLSDLLKRAFYPYAVFFQTVPIVAIAPVLVIWFGFGYPTTVACSFICSLFPIIANTLLGFSSADTSLLNLFRLYSASRWQTLIKLQWPLALPSIFTGLKVSAGLSIIGAIIGEFIAGGGLGSVIDGARTQQRLDKLFAAVLLTAFIGMFFLSTLNGLSSHFLRHWHPSEKKASS